MSGHGAPFILVPWRHDFMQALLDFAVERTGARLGDALFIFPHSRPARYLEGLIRQDSRIAKPCLMPQMLPVGKVFQQLWAETQAPASGIGLLDRVGLLLDCVRAEQQEAPGNLDKLPTDNAEIFFPWGARLANLFEECFIHNRTPSGFLHLEDELLPFAAAILSRLSSLYARYIAALEAKAWATPGLTAQKAVQALAKGYSSASLAAYQHIFIAGFYSPSGTEDVLFKKLWAEHKAAVLWHADPKLMDGKAHWSCAALAGWRKSWGAGLELFESAASGKNTAGMGSQEEPDIAFYGGYDVHSQMAAMQGILAGQQGENQGALESTAIILPDTTLLMPCLHHINTADVNISMGFPLTGTPLNRFFESVLTLHEHTRGGGQYWKDCIQLLRQPYIKMLPGLDNADLGKLWRELLARTEKALRRGKRYVQFGQLMQEVLQGLDSGENLEILEQYFEGFRVHFISAPGAVTTLGSLATALENICTLLINAQSEVWQRFPIDAECLFRFMQSVIPELRESALAEAPMPRSALFSILRELISALRVPFEAYPLTALQIMGLLESRLINFKTVFVLDATDDLLPGAIQNDPLLPDSLRAELGLPNSARRQELNAYYFFRLLNGAEKVHLFWQEGVETRGVLDVKKLKSRFIEELLWKHERKAGRLFKGEASQNELAPQKAGAIPMFSDGPLHRIGSTIAPMLLHNRTLLLNHSGQAQVKRMLSAPLSATRLTKYLRCPASFYYSYITCLEPLESVTESEDPRAVGDIFHQALRDFYSNKLGRPLGRGSLARTELANAFLRALKAHGNIGELPADIAAMLQVSGPRRLGQYLDNQPESTTVLALEVPMHAPLVGAQGATYQLTGQMDRIDQRPFDHGEGKVILDYKTGYLNHVEPEFWKESSIWSTLEEGRANFADNGFFEAIAQQIDDVQLPMYLYLASFGRWDGEKGLTHPSFDNASNVCNAGWVELREEGKEAFLLPEDMPHEERQDIIENKTELLLGYLLDHLAQNTAFFPRPSRLCKYCDFKEICIVL